ncbi:MAG: type II secretion system protein [Candidatus Levybacteria bacterium]|nr:type II secretion system protein [Candidatus Levybacteria bacterium]
MKKVSNQKNKGFTLIELLVVIGILGILVATLVATINPFEQIKKASDSNTKNVAVEYLNANIRYYTNHTEFPFHAAVEAQPTSCPIPDGVVNNSSLINPSGTPNHDLSGCIDMLIKDKELKDGFQTVSGVLKRIVISFDEVNKDLTACYKPESISQRNVLADCKYDSAGSPLPEGTIDECYWCTK